MNNILKKINLLAMAAMFIGGGYAFATTDSSKAQGSLFGNEDGVWIPIDGQSHSCEPASTLCTGRFMEENPAPGSLPLAGSEIYGKFVN